MNVINDYNKIKDDKLNNIVNGGISNNTPIQNNSNPHLILLNYIIFLN